MDKDESSSQSAVPLIEAPLKGIARFARPWLGALLLSVTFSLILYFRFPGKFESYQTHIPPDFGSYLRAWNSLLQGENPYATSFKYSPGFLALIGILPKNPQDAWFAFSTISIAGLCLALMIGARYRKWKDVFYLFLGIALAWKGALETLTYGQVELLVLMLVIVATATFTRFTIVAGAIMGMLPWLKLPLLFLLIPFVMAASRWQPDAEGKPPLRRLKLFVSGFLLSSVFWGAAVPSLAFGPEKALKLSQAWYATLVQQPASVFVSELNQSLWITIDRLLDFDRLTAFGVSGILGGLLLGLLVLRRPHTPTAQDAFVWVTPWLIMTQLVNPLSWRWGSVYLVGACFSAFRPGRRFLWFRGFIWLGVIFFFLLQQNFFVREVLGLSHWTELHDVGVVTGYWVLLLLLSI